MNIREKIISKFGESVLHKSSLLKEEWWCNMVALMGSKYYDTILEIGTFKGVSAAFLSSYCKKLITIDIIDPRFVSDPGHNPARVWKKLGISNIEYHVIKNDIEKILLIEKIKFNFAYLDGDHGKGALVDWLLVRKCGNVLFHDYGGLHIDDIFHPKYCPVKAIVDSLPKEEIKIRGVNALWGKR